MAMENIFEKIRKSNHLPQLPQVMLELVKACGKDSADIDELTRIISTDPALTSKLLQIIASPYVNLPKQVNTIKAAVVYLGLDTIRNIAISSSAMHFFKLSKSLPGFDITRFWYHSYKCGVMAKRIATEEGQANPDEFFLAGLLHDIGSLVLMGTFPKAYGNVMAKVNHQTSLSEAEIEQFSVDTPQVSAWLFTQWHMNPITSDAVLFMNEPLDRIQGELDHVRILYMANLLSEPDPMARMDDLTTLTHIPEIRLEQITAEAEDEVDKMAKNLGVDILANFDRGTAQAIGLEMKDLSLFYGTLDTLMDAASVPKALDLIQKGLQILFHVPRVFFFLLDQEKQILTGTCSPEDRHHKIIQSIALPMASQASLLVKSTTTRTIQTSFLRESLAVSDTQVIRLLESEGLYCIPIIAKGKGIGSMALAADESMAAVLNRNQGLLRLFSRQAGTCLETIGFYQGYASDLNDKKMEAYATLTDKVIHEINNPIAIIKNYIDSLSLKLPDKHPAQEELSVVGEEILRVSSLLEGLSSFSRPKIGGFEMVDINQVCGRVLEILKKSLLLPRQISLQVQMDPGIPAIKTDVNGVKQVLINLIKNAAEAMENGGKIKLHTRILPGSSRVLIDEKRRLPGTVEIQIKDNGPGIPARIRERLFEPYNSSKSGEKNSGLGLSIVHSLVKELGGTITCKSKKGRGTCFSVHLPLMPKRGKNRVSDAGDKTRKKETAHAEE